MKEQSKSLTARGEAERLITSGTERFKRLEAACLYLREYEPPALAFYLAEEIDRVVSLFEPPRDSNQPAASRSEREAEWKNVRRFLRRIDGRVSDREAFESYAREEFVKEWEISNESERREKIDKWLLESPARVKTNRLKNYALNLASVTSNLSDPNFARRRVVDAIVADDEAAFTLKEYAVALDDYGFSESEETRSLCDAMIDFLRDRLLTVPTTEPKRDVASSDSDARNVAGNDAFDEGARDLEIKTNSAEKDGVETDGLKEESAEEFKETNEGGAKGSDGYYRVDESLARAAQEANSFRDYVPGSATREYRSAVDAARDVARLQKEKVDARYHAKIDRILNAYERRLASWYDRLHRNMASCPSVMVAGSGNFPQGKQEKKTRREGELRRERDQIAEMTRFIQSVGQGGIRADDADAVERLRERLTELKRLHEEMKAANKYRREHGSWDGYDGSLKDKVCRDVPEVFQYFNLPNSLAEIHRVDQRIKDLERRARTEYGNGWNFEGGVVKANKEENRLQIFFSSVPAESVRAELRGRGFRWSPRNKAWQRMLTPNAIYAAKQLGFIPEDWRPRSPSDEPDNEN